MWDENTQQVKKGRRLINNSENVSVEMVRNLQSELIYLGLESLFQDEATDREFGAVTLALTREEFEKMKFELRQLKKRFFKDMAMNREFSKGERIYQLNIQFFPITDRSEAPSGKCVSDIQKAFQCSLPPDFSLGVFKNFKQASAPPQPPKSGPGQ